MPESADVLVSGNFSSLPQTIKMDSPCFRPRLQRHLQVENLDRQILPLLCRHLCFPDTFNNPTCNVDILHAKDPFRCLTFLLNDPITLKEFVQDSDPVISYILASWFVI